MKTWILPAYGSLDVLRRDDVPEPAPDAGDVVIHVEAAGVNPFDAKLVTGEYQQMFPVQFPHAMGNDAAGTIASVGTGGLPFKPGDRVLVQGNGGAFGELMRVPAKSVARLPDGVSFVDGASLPTAAGTAWEAIMEKGELRAGQTVLIHAGSGGVGHFAIQFAKLAGAHVIATSSAKNLHLVSDFGADEVIDYQADDFREQASDVDLVLDPLGGETQVRSFDVLKKGGLLVSLVAPPDQALAQQRGVRAMLMSYQAKAERLERIAGLVADGRVRVWIAERFPFSRARDALALVAGGHVSGKVVVTG